MLLVLKVLSDVRRPDAWTTAPTIVPVADTFVAKMFVVDMFPLFDILPLADMFPSATIVDTASVDGRLKPGGGYVAPLMDDTLKDDIAPLGAITLLVLTLKAVIVDAFKIGVDTQLELVMKLPDTPLVPTRVLKTPLSPTICLACVSPVMFRVDVVTAGVDTQFEPVMKEPLMVLEPVSELKFPLSPKICWPNRSLDMVKVRAEVLGKMVEVCPSML
jgi:hypothetical protein